MLDIDIRSEVLCFCIEVCILKLYLFYFILFIYFGLIVDEMFCTYESTTKSCCSHDQHDKDVSSLSSRNRGETVR